MPRIELPPSPPAESGLSVYSPPIMAAMLFPQPSHAEKREQWLAAMIGGSYVEWQRLGAAPEFLARYHIWIPALWAATQAPQRVLEDGLRRMGRAVLAGEVLRYLLATAQHHPRHFRVERARALVSWINRDRKTPSGESLGSSESLVEKAWPEFRPACHLWMAWSELKPEDSEERIPDAHWLAVLSMADGLRLEAERLEILAAGEGWQAPAEVAPRAVQMSPINPAPLAWLNEQFPT